MKSFYKNSQQFEENNYEEGSLCRIKMIFLEYTNYWNWNNTVTFIITNHHFKQKLLSEDEIFIFLI